MIEEWSVQQSRTKSSFYNIVSSNSKWFIAEELLEKHAILICKLFNEQEAGK